MKLDFRVNVNKNTLEFLMIFSNGFSDIFAFVAFRVF